MASDGCRVASIRTERERGGGTEGIQIRRGSCGNVLRNIRGISESRFFFFKNYNSFDFTFHVSSWNLCIFTIFWKYRIIFWFHFYGK